MEEFQPMGRFKMKPKFSILLSLALVGIGGIAIAQIAPMRPNIGVNTNQNSVQMAPSVESLQADIVRLKQKIKSLETENANLNNTIREMTTKGGSQVRAYCSDDLNISRSTAGATEDCTFSGYKCSPVSGLCLRECNTSDDCHPGHLCDTEIHKCVPAPH